MRRALPIVVLAALVVGRVEALDLRFSSQNDVVSRNPTSDDLYTFAFGFDLARDPYRFSLREQAFTDRAAGSRFDETYLVAGRAVPGPGGFRFDVEAGIVHVGHGLLGEDVQNSVHRMLGGDQLALRYEPSSVHATVRAAAARDFRPLGTVTLGPRIEAHLAPGLKAHLVLAGQVTWSAGRSVVVEAFGGGRWTHASLEALEPHLARAAPVARIGIVLHDAVFLSWSYNDHGDRREHVTLGFRRGPGSGSRPGSRDVPPAIW